MRYMFDSNDWGGQRKGHCSLGYYFRKKYFRFQDLGASKECGIRVSHINMGFGS